MQTRSRHLPKLKLGSERGCDVTDKKTAGRAGGAQILFMSDEDGIRNEAEVVWMCDEEGQRIHWQRG